MVCSSMNQAWAKRRRTEEQGVREGSSRYTVRGFFRVYMGFGVPRFLLVCTYIIAI